MNKLIGLAFGYSLMIRVMYSGLIFYSGAIIIEQVGVEPKDVLISIIIVFFSSIGAGMQMN